MSQSKKKESPERQYNELTDGTRVIVDIKGDEYYPIYHEGNGPFTLKTTIGLYRQYKRIKELFFAMQDYIHRKKKGDILEWLEQKGWSK